MKPSMGIFCLEGEWSHDLRKQTTIEPVLQLLKSLDIADYIHRNTVAVEQFEHYVNEWKKYRYDKYYVLYLGTHGAKNEVCLTPNGKNSIPLDRFGELLAGGARGGVIHFGGCSTLDIEDKDLKKLAKVTGASAVTGFRADVDMFTSAAFEVHLLNMLLKGARTDRFFQKLTQEHGVVAEELGLVAATPHRVYRARA